MTAVVRELNATEAKNLKALKQEHTWVNRLLADTMPDNGCIWSSWHQNIV
jgi:hypothetical protein